MKTILVYQDYIHNNGVLVRRLAETFGQEAVHFCDASDILKGCLNPDTVAMFVMPGGADLFYCEKLNGAGNAAIRKYVEQGGTYFGICAGAYYACRRIEWAKNEKDAIIQDRELDFFPGTAIGPLPELIESFETSWAGVARLDTGTAFYRGGCYFACDENAMFETLASYDDARPAIVSLQLGMGRVILSGCHIEHTPQSLAAASYSHCDPSPQHHETIAREFSSSWSPASDLWSQLISSLNR